MENIMLYGYISAVFVVADPPIVTEGGIFVACFTISATPFGSDYVLDNIIDNTPGRC